MNQLILGDNLEIMRKMESESIDLIYLDPPFFSNRNYEVIWGDKGEVRSFEDRWSGGIQHYIAWLEERVREMNRLLKSTGSIYLHCDWHADAYIRVYILDKLFGQNNFRNEIIWCYNGPSNLKSSFANKHDTIFRYTKTDKFTFNKENILIPYSEATLKRRTYSETKKKGIQSQGKDYNEYLKGKVPFDWWDDIPSGGQISRNELIGYPTQKPENLMERIILASSNKGDIVFDPFVGGGTTVVAAEKLQRKWIGIDQSVQAIKVSEMRLDKILYSESNHVGNLYAEPYSITLHKYDYDTLRYKDAFEFESWIIQKFGEKFNFGVIPQNKKGGNKGFDGKTRNGVPIQVKRSDNISVNVVKNFFPSCIINERQGTDKRIKENEPIGYIIAFSFGSGAIQEAAKLKIQENTIIRLVRVNEIVEIAHKPKVTINFNDLGTNEKGLREIEFIATGVSDAGIEFYSWDFNYNEEEMKFKADILLDKEGKQSYRFKPGTHNIAVKVVDNEGLEAIEVVKVKVNGEVSEL